VAIDVACFGELLWDFFEGEKGAYSRHPGGPSANLAVALARPGIACGPARGGGARKLAPPA